MYDSVLAAVLGRHRRSVLVLGPRQVGKSTLLNALGPDIVINLSSPATFRQYVTEPDRLERELLAAPTAARTVLIDEIQRVPALLDAVQSVIDRHPRRFRFLLSGSSARTLQQVPPRINQLEVGGRAEMRAPIPRFPGPFSVSLVTRNQSETPFSPGGETCLAPEAWPSSTPTTASAPPA
jgi:hypothetical protein